MTYPERLYDAMMYPLEATALTERRRRLIPRASGDVLEIGAGTGANVRYYAGERTGSVTLTDLTLADRLGERAQGLQRRIDGDVRVRPADADDLPFPGSRFDTVVFTLVLCSVPDQDRALAEIRRVLRPRGIIIFIEHVRPPGPVRHLVDRANPVWHKVTRECNINRDTAAAIERAGFAFSEYHEGGRGFLIDGVAAKPTS